MGINSPATSLGGDRPRRVVGRGVVRLHRRSDLVRTSRLDRDRVDQRWHGAVALCVRRRLTLSPSRPVRQQGLAKALLRTTFDELRRRGSPAVGLSTDSRTGALDLYVDAGMVVRASYTHYSKILVPGGTAQTEA